MKELFKKNDRYLHRAKIFLTVYLILMSIGIGVLAIIFFVQRAIGVGIVILIVGILSVIVIDFLAKLLISYLFDIKLIRNKLYQEGEETYNEELKNFYTD